MLLLLRFLFSHIPDALITGLGLILLFRTALRVRRHPAVERSLWLQVLAGVALVAGAALLLLSLSLRSMRVSMHFPQGPGLWIGFASLTLVLFLVILTAVWKVVQLMPSSRDEHSPARRMFLQASKAAVFAAPAAAVGYAVFIQRNDLTSREVDLPIANLPKELQGLRLVQLSDIHLSPFLNERDLARAVDMANEFRAHIALVTGDLITTARDPLDRCIAQLARLRAEAGVVGCLGNHEVYAQAEDITQERARRAGIEFLRRNTRVFKFGGKPLNIAGVDYQRMKGPYLDGAEDLVVPGMPNILLSHNPDVFPVAARKGFDATIGGHTHGGQISVEILHQNVSVARFYTPYVYGLYRLGSASAYVTRGIGTVGVPARLGAPPEVALIRLCAT
jgi:predicted MPP superfamily phosphohydrolase